MRRTGVLAGPIDGVDYFAEPSSLRGTTKNGGHYAYAPGDTVTFTLPTRGNPIVLGSKLHSASTDSDEATLLGNVKFGIPVAAVLLALDHGSGPTADVGGIDISLAAAADIRRYMFVRGLTQAGNQSIDAFLRQVQSSVIAPEPLRHDITSDSVAFVVETVLPQLLRAARRFGRIVGPDGTSSRLTGSAAERSVTMVTAPNCEPARLVVNQWALLNLHVKGNVLQAGRHEADLLPVTWHSIYRQEGTTCQRPDGTSVVRPGRTHSTTSIAIGDGFTVESDGTNVRIPGAMFGRPLNCTGGDFAGSFAGAEVPMLTLSAENQCESGAGPSTIHTQIRLAGGF